MWFLFLNSVNPNAKLSFGPDIGPMATLILPSIASVQKRKIAAMLTLKLNRRTIMNGCHSPRTLAGSLIVTWQPRLQVALNSNPYWFGE